MARLSVLTLAMVPFPPPLLLEAEGATYWQKRFLKNLCLGKWHLWVTRNNIIMTESLLSYFWHCSNVRIFMLINFRCWPLQWPTCYIADTRCLIQSTTIPHTTVTHWQYGIWVPYFLHWFCKVLIDFPFPLIHFLDTSAVWEGILKLYLRFCRRRTYIKISIDFFFYFMWVLRIWQIIKSFHLVSTNTWFLISCARKN